MADKDSPAANDSGQTGSMPLLYKDPKPLNADNFGKSGLKTGTDFRFTANINTVPCMISEFQHAQKTFPIFFVGDPPMPVVAMGFAAGENLFVSPEGLWAEDAYVPNYIRRYPFILAEVPNDERLYLCADAKADMIVEKGADLPFFNEDKQTDVVTRALDFCRAFQEDFVNTRALCTEIRNLNLLRPAEVLYVNQAGQQQSGGQVVSIDFEKFNALPDSTFLDFRKRGILPLIYFQVTSQQNWSRLHFRRERRLGAAIRKPS